MNPDNNDRLSKAVSAGVVQGFRELLQDQDLMAQFWEQGFDKLTSHAGDGASKWVGKRILVGLVAAVLIWSMGWLVRHGGIK